MNVHLNTGKSTGLFIPDQDAAQVLVFKTNLLHQKDIVLVTPALNGLPGMLRWNVDQEDIDKVLRVETTSLTAHTIIELVNKAGYYCEELPD
jgi:hypothetical protein